jgi:hypothetical protein
VCQRTRARPVGAYTWALQPELGLAENPSPRPQPRATTTAMKDCHVRHAEARRCGRLQDWFVIQTVAVKLTVLVMTILIPVTSIYSFTLVQKQAALAEQVRSMAVAGNAGDGVWKLKDNLPVVLGSGSLLGFLAANTADSVTVIYKPLMWNVSERIVLVEAQGTQHAYYPSDMETKIFADKAVSAPWGSKLLFVPRSELRPAASNCSIVWMSASLVPARSPRRMAGRPASAACCRPRSRSACWLSFSSSSRASSSRSSSSSRRRSRAPSTTWWAWTISRPRWHRSRISISAERSMPSTASSSPSM